MSCTQIGKGFPRLMARYLADEPIELLRGHVTTADRLALTANMHAPDWEVWVARATPEDELISDRHRPACVYHAQRVRRARLNQTEIIELDRSGVTEASPQFAPYTLEPQSTGT